jgi:hypothetical protein
MKHAIKTIVLVAAISFTTINAQASTRGNSNFIVQTLSTNPEFAKNRSQDLLLHAGTNGNTYLYVEQQQGTLLTVFDVTDPGHMKLIASVPTQARGSFDFVTPIGSSAELIMFRDGSGSAVLDLRKQKAPRVTMIEGATAAPTEMLGTSGYLSSTAAFAPLAREPRNVQLVETSYEPRLLTTISEVTHEVHRSETGTIFLINDGKVTVIRRLDAEREHAAELDRMRDED